MTLLHFNQIDKNLLKGGSSKIISSMTGNTIYISDSEREMIFYFKPPKNGHLQEDSSLNGFIVSG